MQGRLSDWCRWIYNCKISHLGICMRQFDPMRKWCIVLKCLCNSSWNGNSFEHINTYNVDTDCKSSFHNNILLLTEKEYWKLICLALTGELGFGSNALTRVLIIGYHKLFCSTNSNPWWPSHCLWKRIICVHQLINNLLIS